LAVGVRGTPVPSGEKVEPLRGTGGGSVDGLIGPSVNEIVAWIFNALRVWKFSGVIRGAEFVVTGILFARLAVRRFGGIDEVADFVHEDRRIFNLEVEAGGVLLIGIAIAGEHRCFDIQRALGNHPNFRRRSCSRIKGLEGGRKKVAEGIVQRLDDVGAAIFLNAVKIEAGELSCAEKEAIVQKGLLEPKRIEARSMSADEAARIGDDAHVSAKIDAILPESGDVEGKTVPVGEFTEVDVHRSAETAPTAVALSEAADGIGKQVRNIEEVEGHSFVCKMSACASPIAECVLARLERCRRGGRRWGRGSFGIGLC
jgi:hypothetical protein